MREFAHTMNVAGVNSGETKARNRRRRYRHYNTRLGRSIVTLSTDAATRTNAHLLL